MDETENASEGLECQGHSIWTICIPLSHFYSEDFPIFFTFIMGGQFILPAAEHAGLQVALSLFSSLLDIESLLRDTAFSDWMIQKGLSARDIQSGLFAQSTPNKHWRPQRAFSPLQRAFSPFLEVPKMLQDARK